jgi:hypothetical protein
MITEKVFWPNKAHGPAKENTPSQVEPSRTKTPLRSNPAFVFYMCIYKKNSLSLPRLELYLCFLKIENSYKNLDTCKLSLKQTKQQTKGKLKLVTAASTSGILEVV